MGYDWRPSGTRSATSGFHAVVGRSETTSTGTSGPDVTVASAAEEFLHAAETGAARNRSGRPYKPSALRDLRGCLHHHVVAELGDLRLRAVRRSDVQALVDRLGAEQLSEGRIRSVISALRALYAYAIGAGHVEFNPADGLVMPVPAREGEPRSAPLGWWADGPRPWEDRPAAADAAGHPGSPRLPREPPAPAPQAAAPVPPWAAEDDGHRVAREPLAVVPERMLSLALRAVLVLLAFAAAATLLESV